jgi:D-glycero-alpha-D-manno-heptose-7-phosphate kinase
VDLWPLYLLVDPRPNPAIRPKTINLAIDLYATATLSLEDLNDLTSPGQVTLLAEDQKKGWAADSRKWEKVNLSTFPQSLQLHARLIQLFSATLPEGRHLTLSTRAGSPAGAGLGGSSALSIAIASTLWRWKVGPLETAEDKLRLIEMVRDVESQVLHGPAGLQDYYGAAFGGLQQLTWGIGRNESTHFGFDRLRELERRILLFYSGKSRNSGINNWKLYKDLVDGKTAIRRLFSEIVAATADLESALLSGDWKEAGKAIAREWRSRQKLSRTISTPEISRAFQKALRAGARAGKICGAGGGGCFFVFLESDDEDLRRKVIEKVETPVIRHLPFRAVPHGVTLSRNTDA